jgi:hypothetical protein
MKTTVTLSDENVAGLAWAVKLTGLSLEKIVNLLLTGEITCFRSDGDWNEYVENTLGCLKLKDRASAERTLQWVKKKVPKGRRCKFPIFEGEKSKPAVFGLTLLQLGGTASSTGYPKK